MSRFLEFINNIKMLDFPEYRQPDGDSCGATAMHMILSYYGEDENLEVVEKIAGTNHEYGTPISGIKKVVEKYKIKYNEGTFTIDDLKKNVDAGFPTLLMLQAWSIKDNVDWKNEWDQGHYVVVRGYSNKNIYFADPINIKIDYLSYDDLMERWHGWDDNNKKIYNWGIVFMKTGNYKFDATEEMD